jgi:HD superfamily phosphohydrolase
LNRDGDGIAITHKGRTAAEMMVFARYVMFSEVYWHHAVRSATAMLQRAFFRWYLESGGLAENIRGLFCKSETEMIDTLQVACRDQQAHALGDGLFGQKRALYKRLVSYACFDNQLIYRQLAQRTYPWLVECGQRLAEILSQQIGQKLQPDDVLIDSPPVGLEVQFNVDVYDQRQKRFRSLEDVSPVVGTLAKRQFDDFVKQVRVFVHPRLATSFRDCDCDKLVQQAIEQVSG